MSEPVKTTEEETTSPQVEKKTPSKRSRMSFIERAQKESEELVKNMGGSLELEGGRRTRSSARGTPSRATITPPPTKKSRNSPASPKTTTPRGRGRGRKLEASTTPEPTEQPSKEQEDEDKEKAPEATSTEPSAEKVADPAQEKVPDKDKSSSETNGPEQSEGEHVNDSEIAEAKQTEQSVVAKSEETKIDNEQSVKDNKKPLVDQTDAVVETKTLLEEETAEKQNNVEEHHQSKKEEVEEEDEEEEEEVKANTLDEPAKETLTDDVDSPMEVDNEAAIVAAKETVAEESALPEKVAECPSSIDNVESVKTTEPEATTIVSDEVLSTDTLGESIKPFGIERKLPTPEPMEVDSSSKSSDVIECTDVVDKADVVVDNSILEEKTTAPIEIPAPVVLAPNNDSTANVPVQIVSQFEQKIEENCTAIEANPNSVVTVVGNDVVPPPPQPPITLLPTPEEIKSINTTAIVLEESKLEAAIENKSENNVVESKLAPEVQVNAGGDAAVTTS